MDWLLQLNYERSASPDRGEAISAEEAIAVKRAAEGYGGPLRGTLARYVKTVGCASLGACTW